MASISTIFFGKATSHHGRKIRAHTSTFMKTKRDKNLCGFRVTRFSKSSYTDMQARGGSKRRRASDDKKFSHTGFSISGEGGGGEEGEESKYSLFEDHPADFRTIPGCVSLHTQM